MRRLRAKKEPDMMSGSLHLTAARLMIMVPFTLPVSGLAMPVRTAAFAIFDPAIGHVRITPAFRDPVSPDPNVPPAFPIPVAGRPNKARARRRHHLDLRGRGRDFDAEIEIHGRVRGHAQNDSSKDCGNVTHKHKTSFTVIGNQYA